MRKLFAVLSALLVISTASGNPQPVLDEFELEEDIHGFNPVFEEGLYGVGWTHQYSVLLGEDGKLNKVERAGTTSKYLPVTRHDGQFIFLSGFRFPGRWVLSTRNSTILERSYPYAVDGASLFRDQMLLSRAVKGEEIKNLDGDTLVSKDFHQGALHPVYEGYLPAIDEEGAIFRVNTGELVGITNEKEFEISLPTGGKVNADVHREIYVVWWKNGLRTYKNSGNIRWSLDDSISTEVAAVNGKIVYGSGEQLKSLSLDSGETLTTRKFDQNPNSLARIGSGHVVVLFDNKLRILNSGTLETLRELEVGGSKVYTADSGATDMAAVVSKDKIVVISPDLEASLEEYSSNQSYLVSGREGFKAIATGNEVQVKPTEEEKHSLKPETNYTVSDSNNLGFNNRFNYTRDTVYVPQRKMAVWLAPWAAKNNYSITFQEENSDIVLDDYSRENLRSLLIDNETNHVIAGNLTGRNQLVAAEIAARTNSVPINISEKTELTQKIEEGFQTIGKNPESVLDGEFVSLLGIGMDKFKSQSSLYEEDNFSSLQEVRNNGYNVGYYPNKTGLASRMFSNSMDPRENGSVVAAEYLSGLTPVVASTFGGGARQGLEIYGSLEKAGDSEFYVERRSDPVGFLMSLAPKRLIQIVDTSMKIEKTVTEYITQSVGALFSHLYIIIEAARYAGEMIYLTVEHDWSTAEFEPGQTVQNLKDIDWGSLGKKNGKTAKEVIEALLSSFWPEQHPDIDQESLSSAGGHRSLFYVGRGNQSSWTLPRDKHGIFTETYTEEYNLNNMETAPDIIWDSTPTPPDSDKIQAAVSRGSSNILSFTISPTSSSNARLASFAIRNGNPETPFHNVDTNKTQNTHFCTEDFCEIQLKLNSTQLSNPEDFTQVGHTYEAGPGVVPSKVITYEKSLPKGVEITDRELEVEWQNLERNITAQDYLLRTDGSHQKVEKANENTVSLEPEEVSLQAKRRAFRNGSLKRMDSLDFRLRYESPYSVDSKVENGTGFLEVRKPREVELEVYWDGSNSGSTHLTENTTRKTIKIGRLNRTRSKYRVGILRDDDIVLRRDLVLRKDPELNIRIQEGPVNLLKQETVRFEVVNPSKRSRSYSFSLDPDENLLLGVGQKEFIEGPIQGGETRVHEVELIVLKPGSGKIEVGSENLSIHTQFRSKNLELSSARFNLSSASLNAEFSELEFGSNRKKVKIRQRPGRTVYTLLMGKNKSEWILEDGRVCIRSEGLEQCVSQDEVSLETFPGDLPSRHFRTFRRFREKIGGT